MRNPKNPLVLAHVFYKTIFKNYFENSILFCILKIFLKLFYFDILKIVFLHYFIFCFKILFKSILPNTGGYIKVCSGLILVYCDQFMASNASCVLTCTC